MDYLAWICGAAVATAVGWFFASLATHPIPFLISALVSLWGVIVIVVVVVSAIMGRPI